MSPCLYRMFTAASTILLALALSACSDEEPSCSSQADCFAGEVCVAGSCEDPMAGEDDAGGDMPVSDMGADTGDATDIGPEDTGGDSGAGDGGPEDLGAEDQGADVGGDMDALACIVDPFDVCMDDEDQRNDNTLGLPISTSNAGCQSDGSFEAFDMTISGVLCPLEERDNFSLPYAECEDEGFFIEAILTPKTDCDPSLISFDSGAAIGSCGDQDTDLQCTMDPDGTMRIQALIPASNLPKIRSARFELNTFDRDDIRFEYDLQIRVYR